MPLTARKIKHIEKMQAKWFQGRTQLVILTMRTPTGGTTTKIIDAIWRVVADFDPLYEGPTNALTHLGTEADVIAEFDTDQLTHSELKSVLWAVLGANAEGVQPATKYTLTDIEVLGIPIGGDRYLTRWTRQH